jgi:hypothetical protein
MGLTGYCQISDQVRLRKPQTLKQVIEAAVTSSGYPLNLLEILHDRAHSCINRLAHRSRSLARVLLDQDQDRCQDLGLRQCPARRPSVRASSPF